MKFTINRSWLVMKSTAAEYILVRHAEAAEMAVAYARKGNRECARICGRAARNHLQAYLQQKI